MQTKRSLSIAAAVLLAALALASCGGGNPQAQAQPGGVTDILPTPPPMPTSAPLPPTPTPGPAPSGSIGLAGATTMFDANFSDAGALSNWKVVDGYDVLRAPSVWQIEGGQLKQVSDSDGGPGNYPTALVTGAPDWTNYQVSVTAFNTGNDEMGVVVRAGDVGHYVFRFLPNGTGGATRIISRFNQADYTYTDLATAEGPGFEQRRWYQLSVRVEGDKIQALIDGQPVVEARDASLARGGAGVYGYAQGNLLFGKVIVQALP